MTSQDGALPWDVALETYSQYSGATAEGLQRYTSITTGEPWSPYLVKAVVEATPRGPRCVDVRLQARPDGEPITPAGLRRVPLGRIVALIADILPAQLELGDTPEKYAARERTARARYRRAVTRSQQNERRWQLDDKMLEKVADVYRDAVRHDQPPTAAVQEYFRLGTRARAARWVKRAREEGHLGPAPGRRISGEQENGS